MNFKEKFNIGNDFIFSPNGVISRKKYFLYAVVLDITFRVICSISGVSGKEISPIFYAFMILLLPIAILKFFNYKKRAFGFLNNNVKANIFAGVYMSIGFIVALYTTLLRLMTNKMLNEYAPSFKQHDGVFDHLVNINIPDFIGSHSCNVAFFILCGLGLLMFLLLIFYPSKTTSVEVLTAKKDDNIKIKINIPEGFKEKIFRKIIIIPSIILYLYLLCVSYSEINWRAYSWMHFVLDDKQIEYVNPLIKLDYETQFNEWSANEQAWNDCLKKHKDIIVRSRVCGFTSRNKFNRKPEPPHYYKVESNTLYPTLYSRDFDYFGCNINNFSLLSHKCGDLTFNKFNRFYVDFHPYVLLILSIIFLFPLSIVLSLFVEFIILFAVKLFKKINWSKIKDFVKKSSIKKTTLSKKLEELNELKEKGLITEEDYNCKKAELLKDF